MAAGAYAFYTALVALMPVNPFTGWASLAWHMAVAPYAYPRLLGAAALGLAAALWIQREDDRSRLSRRTAKWGLILGMLGALIVTAVPGGWPANAGELVAIPAFAGLALLLYSGATKIAERTPKPLPMKLAIVCGMLAFPIFIGHGVVIPAKSALQAYGVPAALAILAPAALFLATMTGLGWRIYRMMFGRTKG